MDYNIELIAAAKYPKGMRLLFKEGKEAYIGTVTATRSGEVHLLLDDGRKTKIKEKSKLIFGEAVKRKVTRPILLENVNSYLKYAVTLKKDAAPSKERAKEIKKSIQTKLNKLLKKEKAKALDVATVSKGTVSKGNNSFSPTEAEDALRKIFKIKGNLRHSSSPTMRWQDGFYDDDPKGASECIKRLEAYLKKAKAVKDPTLSKEFVLSPLTPDGSKKYDERVEVTTWKRSSEEYIVLQRRDQKYAKVIIITVTITKNPQSSLYIKELEARKEKIDADNEKNKAIYTEFSEMAKTLLGAGVKKASTREAKVNGKDELILTWKQKGGRAENLYSEVKSKANTLGFKEVSSFSEGTQLDTVDFGLYMSYKKFKLGFSSHYGMSAKDNYFEITLKYVV